MRDVVMSLTAFLICVLTHVAWCRLRRQKEGLMPFAVLSVCFLVILFLVTRGTVDSSAGPGFNLWTLPLKGTAVILYLLWIPVYLIFYYSTLVESPSRTILNYIAHHPKCSYQDIVNHLENNHLLTSRLRTMEEFHTLVVEGRRYRLTAGGRMAARLLRVYQFIFGRPVGG
jgi:hypothetical protein